MALVNLSRMVETKKAEKLRNNLHLIGLQKQNTHIKFVSDYDEIKQASMKQDK